MRHMSVTIEDKIWVKSLMKGSLCLRGVVGSTREFKYEYLRGYNYNPSNSPAPKEEVLKNYGVCWTVMGRVSLMVLFVPFCPFFNFESYMFYFSKFFG